MMKRLLIPALARALLLSACAEHYFRRIGMSDDEFAALKDNFGKDYTGGVSE